MYEKSDDSGSDLGLRIYRSNTQDKFIVKTTNAGWAQNHTTVSGAISGAKTINTCYRESNNDGGSMYYYRDGTLKVSDTNNVGHGTLNVGTSMSLSIGEPYVGIHSGLKAGIAEILVFNRELTGSERATIESYLNTK